MDNSFEENEHENNMVINGRIKKHLSETAKWGKFIAIVGLVLVGLGIIFTLLSGTIMTSLVGSSSAGMLEGGFFFFSAIIISLIYIFPLWYLWKFSIQMQVALKENNQDILESSLKSLKSLYKFMGIFLCVIIALYALIFAGTILFGVSL